MILWTNNQQNINKFSVPQLYTSTQNFKVLAFEGRDNLIETNAEDREEKAEPADKLLSAEEEVGLAGRLKSVDSSRSDWLGLL